MLNNLSCSVCKDNFKYDMLKFLLLFAIGWLGLAAAPAPAEIDNAGIIRIHIFANSDSFADQSIKAVVKDGVMEYVARLTADCRTKDETAVVIKAHLTEIAAVAEGIAANYGSSAQTVYGVFRYGERFWQGETMAAGDYESLRITLGDGRGHNWFCVLYPDFCGGTGTLEYNLADDKNNTDKFCRNSAENYESNKGAKCAKGAADGVQVKAGSFFLRLLAGGLK